MPYVGGAINEIAAERERQITVEGYSLEHDDEHTKGELARAAASFALLAAADAATLPHEVRKWAASVWPFAMDELREKRSAIRMLVIAGALIVAEIERHRRQAEEGGT